MFIRPGARTRLAEMTEVIATHADAFSRVFTTSARKRLFTKCVRWHGRAQ
jgi:hypothetical protein